MSRPRIDPATRGSIRDFILPDGCGAVGLFSINYFRKKKTLSKNCTLKRLPPPKTDIVVSFADGHDRTSALPRSRGAHVTRDPDRDPNPKPTTLTVTRSNGEVARVSLRG